MSEYLYICVLVKVLLCRGINTSGALQFILLELVKVSLLKGIAILK